jgi:hypothetical protein
MLARIVAVLAVVAALAFAAWYFLWPRGLPPPPPASTASAPAPAPQPSEGPRHPVETKPDVPLPALKESDPVVIEGLAGLLGKPAIAKFLNLDEVVRRIVATVDNLPRESYATRLNPVKPIGGLFIASGSGDKLAIAPGNAARYAEFVKLAESVDSAQAVALYLRFYPLFQQAYRDLGYPDGYFNDRLVDVIDHLLATPEVRGPVALVTPHVLYEYASAELEERSSGQKAMLRMGPENATRLKAKLRELRAELIKQSGR